MLLMIRYISIAQLKSVSDAFFLILSVSIYIGFQAAVQTISLSDPPPPSDSTLNLSFTVDVALK